MRQPGELGFLAQLLLAGFHSTGYAIAFNEKPWRQYTDVMIKLLGYNFAILAYMLGYDFQFKQPK